MNHARQRISGIWRGQAPGIMELIFGAALLLWGLWIANPFMETFSSSPTYSTLVHLCPPGLAPEVFHGCGMALTGASMLVATAFGSLEQRQWTTLWGMAALAFLGINFQLSLPQTPAAVWFGSFVVALLWGFYQLPVKRYD